MLKGVSSFKHLAYKDVSTHDPVLLGKECHFDAGTCFMVCREGTPIFGYGGYTGHALTSESSLSGKTSVIHAIAGELGLDIYAVSLSSKG
jgi:hypothetical protein